MDERFENDDDWYPLERYLSRRTIIEQTSGVSFMITFLILFVLHKLEIYIHYHSNEQDRFDFHHDDYVHYIQLARDSGQRRVIMRSTIERPRVLRTSTTLEVICATTLRKIADSLAEQVKMSAYRVVPMQ